MQMGESIHSLLLTKLAFLLAVKQNLQQEQKLDLVSDHDLTQQVLEQSLTIQHKYQFKLCINLYSQWCYKKKSCKQTNIYQCIYKFSSGSCMETVILCLSFHTFHTFVTVSKYCLLHKNTIMVKLKCGPPKSRSRITGNI